MRSDDSVLTLAPPLPASAASVDAEGAALHVAVEAKRLLREVRGIGRYVWAMLPRLVALRPGLQLTLFVRNLRDADAVTATLEHVPALRGRVQILPIREMLRSSADVFWYPWNTVSVAPAGAAVVVTVHDVVPIAHPDPRLRGWQKNLRWRWRYAATARRATLIVADSQFTADEAHRLLDIPYERIRVALLSADDLSVPPPTQDEEVLARLGVTRPFVLTVGAADRRKNLELLERAMPRVLASLPDVRLVLAGPRRAAGSPLANAPWSKTLGFVSDGELATLYRCAGVFVMPSTYEGFGLPVLEAMRLGAPVISTHTSSLPEVGGTAAAWIDPDDDAKLAALITRVIADPALAATMRAASRAQAARFSWNETARLTLDAFDAAVEMTRGAKIR